MGIDAPRIGFVGAGRLANVLAVKLAAAGYAVTGVSSRRQSSAQSLAERLPGCAVFSSLETLAQVSDLVFITVPDDAIASVAAGVPWRAGVAAVHCSGALGLEALEPATQRGAFHPLQTFATPDTELVGISVAIEASGRLLDTLEEMAVRLGCLPLRLPEGGRALYHASGAFGHNYVVTLFAQAVRLWGLLGFSETQALQALLPLAKTSLVNIERLGVASALTGPIVRGDAGTVRRHLEALQASAPDLLPIYRELGEKSLALGQLEPGVAAEIEAILSNPKESQPCV
jgi:predicted short-subunit dehydrogenase-like oxidoreductase (DUF2520 family)